MNGDRDSEIALVLEDLATETSSFGGSDCLISPQIREFRMRLMREHLGLEKEDMSCVDPVTDEFYYNTWKKTSHNNTRCYRRVFNTIYHQDVPFLNTLQKRMTIQNEEDLNSALTDLENNVRGQLFDFNQECFEAIEDHGKLGHAVPGDIFL